MNILLINDFGKEFGGAEVVVHNTNKLLIENGHNVDSFTGGNGGIISFFSRYFSLNYFFQIFFLLLKKDIKYDVAHIHGLSRNLSVSILLPLKFYGVKVIYTLHDYHFYCPKTRGIFEDGNPCELGFNNKCRLYNCYHPKKSKLYHFLKWIKVFFHRYFIKKYVSEFIVLNDHMKNVMPKSLGVSSSKFHLIPNYYETSDTNYSDLPLNNYFLFVGRLSLEKGVEVALKAVSNLVSKGYNNISFQIIGDGPNLNRLKKMTKRLNIENNIIFHGRINNQLLGKYYYNALALLIPSIWLENNPLVGLEAMGNSTPVIATDIGGLPNMISEGENGFLFKLRNDKELSSKMELLINNSSLSYEMGRKGNLFLKDKFNKNNYYESLIGVYKINKIIL